VGHERTIVVVVDCAVRRCLCTFVAARRDSPSLTGNPAAARGHSNQIAHSRSVFDKMAKVSNPPAMVLTRADDLRGIGIDSASRRVSFSARGGGATSSSRSRVWQPNSTAVSIRGPTLTSPTPSTHDPQTPAVGKKAAKTPKKAGKSTKRTKRVESYRFVRPRAFKVAKRRSLRRRPPT
jgi:hypothetical protein